MLTSNNRLNIFMSKQKKNQRVPNHSIPTYVPPQTNIRKCTFGYILKSSSKSIKKHSVSSC